jgi:hypothetical protein
MSENTIYEDIGSVVSLMRGGNTFDETFDIYSRGQSPYYMYGHRAEINNRLENLSKGKTTKLQKYPLVALKLDVEESVEGGISSFDLNIGLFAITKENYNAEERVENVFKPILYPLYELFFEKLASAGIFLIKGSTKPEHTKVDRPFYGTQDTEGNIKRIFSDPLDCVEILNLKLKKRNC